MDLLTKAVAIYIEKKVGYYGKSIIKAINYGLLG